MTNLITVAFDTETHLFRYPDKVNPPVVCLAVAVPLSHKSLIADAPVTHMRHGWFTGLYPKEQCGPKFLELLKNPNLRLVAHNASFDLHVLTGTDRVEIAPYLWKALKAGRISDTMIRDQIYALGTKGHLVGHSASLINCLKRWLDIHLSVDAKADPNSVRFQYESLETTPITEWSEEAVLYAVDDAAYTLALWHEQENRKLASGPGSINQEPLNVASDYALRGIQIGGIRTDQAQVQKLRERYEPKFEAAKAQLAELGLMREDGTLDKGAVAKLVIRLCLEQGRRVKTTDSGAVCTSRDFLLTLACDDPGYLALMDYSNTLKACTTFIPQFSEPRLHPAFNNIVSTLRTSCRSSNYHLYQGNRENALTKTGKLKKVFVDALPATNFQQIPQDPEFRKVFIPEEGCLFVDIDYENLEFVCAASRLAHYTGYDDLRQLLNTGVNIHDALCCRIFSDVTGHSMTFEEALVVLKDDTHIHHKALKAARNYLTKQISLGVSGGLQTKTAFDNIKKSLSKFVKATGYEAEQLVPVTEEMVDSWLAYARDRFREFHSWFGPNGQLWDFRRHQVWNGYGGDCFGVYLGRRKKNEISNALLMQAVGAIGAKRALVSLYQRTEDKTLGSVLYGSKIHAIIHDEFLMSCPADKIIECRDEMANVMIGAMHTVVPDMRVGVEASVQAYWSKSSTEGWDEVKYHTEPKTQQVQQ